MTSQLIPPTMLTVPRTSMATSDMMDISMEHGAAVDIDKPSAFAEAMKTLGRHKLLAALVASLVFGAGALVTFNLPKTYLAKAVVVIPPVDVDPLFSGHTADASRLDDDRVATEVSMLQSRDHRNRRGKALRCPVGSAAHRVAGKDTQHRLPKAGADGSTVPGGAGHPCIG